MNRSFQKVKAPGYPPGSRITSLGPNIGDRILGSDVSGYLGGVLTTKKAIRSRRNIEKTKARGVGKMKIMDVFPFDADGIWSKWN